MKVKLSSIVSQYLDLYNLGKAEYARAYRIAVRGWREMNWDVTGKVKTVSLNVSQDKTIALPEDFISIVDFGESNNSGGIRSYTKTDNFLSQDLFDDSNTKDYTNYPYINQNYEFDGHSLGVGSYNNSGYYNIDLEKRLITLNPQSVATNLELKYVSHSGKDCTDHEIDELATEALIAFLDWQLSKVDKRIGVAEKREKERMYYNEKSKARLRIKKLTRAIMNQNSRESVKMSIKS